MELCITFFQVVFWAGSRLVLKILATDYIIMDGILGYLFLFLDVDGQQHEIVSLNNVNKTVATSAVASSSGALTTE